MHAFPHHNGGVTDAQQWEQYKAAYHIAQMLGFVDWGRYLYVAGDASRAYSPQKLAYFTRQIVYCRPDTFVIFDRVKAQRPNFRKTWLVAGHAGAHGQGPEPGDHQRQRPVVRANAPAGRTQGPARLRRPALQL